HTQSRGPGRDIGAPDRLNDNASLIKLSAELGCGVVAVEEDRKDRHGLLGDAQAELREARVEATCVRPETLHALGFLLQQLKARERGRHGGWWEGRGEQKASGGVSKEVDQVTSAGDESPDAPKRLAEGSHQNFDAAFKSEMFEGPLAASTKHAGRMCV